MRSPLRGESFELIDVSLARWTPGDSAGHRISHATRAQQSMMAASMPWHASAVCNLQYAVADLLAEHELGVGRHAHQDLVELQLAAV